MIRFSAPSPVIRFGTSTVEEIKAATKTATPKAPVSLEFNMGKQILATAPVNVTTKGVMQVSANSGASVYIITIRDGKVPLNLVV